LGRAEKRSRRGDLERGNKGSSEGESEKKIGR